MNEAYREIAGLPDSPFVSYVIDKISKDDLGHYLSLSIFSHDALSYAKHEQDRFIEPRRVMTTLGRYITRKYSEERKSISDSTLDTFVRFVERRIPRSERARKFFNKKH